MKKFKKIMAVLAAATLTMGSMTVPAFADDYTLTYDINGGNSSVVSDTSGDVKTITTTLPTHDDVGEAKVAFIGWTETKFDILEADASVPETYFSNPGTYNTATLYEDKTLYALWGYNRNGNNDADVVDPGAPITISYNGNGSGVTNVPGGYKTKPGDIRLSNTEPHRDGFVFLGWTEGSSSADVAASGSLSATYYAKNTVRAGINANTTYYAGWAVDANNDGTADYDQHSHTVTYNMNKNVQVNGIVRDVIAGDAPGTETILEGTTFAPTSPTVKTGTAYDEVHDVTVNLAFVGWSDSKTGKVYAAGETISILKNELTMGTDDIELYAVWGYDSEPNGVADIAETEDYDTAKIVASNTSGTASPETHKAYKIFDVTKTEANSNWVQGDGNNGTTNNLGIGTTPGFAYSISATDTKWLPILWDTNSETAPSDQTWVTLTKSADGSKYLVTWAGNKNAEAAAAFGDWLRGKATANSIGPDATFDTGEILYTEPGYYMIDSSLGTKLVMATSSILLNEKNLYVSDTKVATTKSVRIGTNEEYYYIKVFIPATVDTKKDVIVHDTMDSVLKLNRDSFLVQTTVNDPGDTATSIAAALSFVPLIDTIYDVETNTDDDCTFEITIDLDASGADFAGKYVVFRYTAEMTSDSVADTDYANTAYTEYSKFTTTPTTVNVKTYDFDFTKVDAANTQINGAVFELRTTADNSNSALSFVRDAYYTDGTYTQVKATGLTTDYKAAGSTGTAKLADTDDTDTTKNIVAGKVTVSGLGAGTYYLVETLAPAGYNMLTEPITVIVTDEGSYTISQGSTEKATGLNPEFEIINTTSTNLPSTGGMGTTVLYIVGGMLVILAGAYLFFSRKRTA